MPLDFPASPNVNDTYSFGGKTWIWTGAYWRLNITGAINDIPIGNITASTGNFTTITGSSAVFSGNVTADYMIGNGSLLTGISTSTSEIFNGDSNVNIDLANADITMSVASVSNVVVVGTDGVTVTGNVTANSFIGDGSQLTGVGSFSINTLDFTGDGSTTAFTIINGFTANSVMVFENGVAQQPGTDYTVSGNVLTLTSAPGAGVALQARLFAPGVGNVNLSAISQDLVPAANVTYDLGTAANRWRDIYLAGNTIYLGSVEISAEGGNLLLPNVIQIGNVVLDASSGNLVLPELIQAETLEVTGNISAGNIVTQELVRSPLIVTNVILSDDSSLVEIQDGLTVTGDIVAQGNVNAGNVSGTNIMGTLTTADQPMITSVGTLTSLDVTGNVSAGNVAGTNLAGTITTASQPNITGLGTLTSLDVTGNVTAGNLSGTNIVGTLTTASQPNITSVGTLASLAVTGNISAGNLSVSGIESVGTLTINNDATIIGNLTVQGNTITANVTSLVISDPIINLGRGANNTPLTSNDGLDRGVEMFYFTTSEQIAFMGYDNNEGKMIVASNVSVSNNIITVNEFGTTQVGGLEAATATVTGNVSAGNVSGTNITGTLTTASQPNITGLGTLGSLSVTGNITGGNVSGTNITGTIATASQPNITGLGTLGSLTVTGNVTAGNVSGTNITGTIATASQPNITGLGTLTSLTVTGNVGGGNINTAGAVVVTGTGAATSTTTGSLRTAGGLGVGGNIYAGGLLSVTGNIIAGNISAGNIAGNYFIGNGSQLTGINTSTNRIFNGTSNVDIASANADVTVTVAGLANLAVFSTDGLAVSGNIELKDQGILRLADSDSSNWVAFQAPATVPTNVTWTLPAEDGTSGQVLSTSGNGTLSWSSGGSTATGGILLNNTTVTANTTIDAGTNGLSVGPMTLSTGTVFSVTTGQRWVIL